MPNDVDRTPSDAQLTDEQREQIQRQADLQQAAALEEDRKTAMAPADIEEP